jgi:hypothetical protein
VFIKLYYQYIKIDNLSQLEVAIKAQKGMGST